MRDVETFRGTGRARHPKRLDIPLEKHINGMIQKVWEEFAVSHAASITPDSADFAARCSPSTTKTVPSIEEGDGADVDGGCEAAGGDVAVQKRSRARRAVIAPDLSVS